jgi:hypothetical protein
MARPTNKRRPPDRRPKPQRRRPWWIFALAVPVAGALVVAVILIADYTSEDSTTTTAFAPPTTRVVPTAPTAPPITQPASLPEGWSTVPAAPGGSRTQHDALWTGTEMIVVGGSPQPGTAANPAVEAFNPATDEWRTIGETPHPYTSASAVWTGTEIIVWGGETAWNTGPATATGARLDPATGVWDTTAPTQLRPRSDHLAVWTGTEMIVWGGRTISSGFYVNRFDGAAYDPATDTWRPIADAPLEIIPVAGGAGLWTGETFIVWGFPADGGPDTDPEGMAYDPVSDEWTEIAASGLGFGYFESAWTGSELLVVGGTPDLEFVAMRYDPAADSWRGARNPPGDFRQDHTVTATEDGGAIVVGGDRNVAFGPVEAPIVYDGARWSFIADAPIANLVGHTSVWTGESLIVFGGHGGSGPTVLDYGYIWTPPPAG